MNLSRTQKLLTGQQSFSSVPNTPDGIILGERRKGFFSVVEPVDETTNLIANTSFRTGDYPYSHLTSSAVKTYISGYILDGTRALYGGDRDTPECYPMYGGWAQFEPIDGDESRVIYRLYDYDVVDGEQYTFSCFICGSESHFYNVHVDGWHDTSPSYPTQITSKNRMRGTGNWQRLHITFTADTSTFMYFDLVLSREATTSNPTDKFWTSFWVCEDNPFLTLPFNGGCEEKNSVRNNINYYSWITGHEWNGKSVRSDRASSSGRERYLQDYGFVLTGITGLGSSGINHVLQPLSSGGSVWNTTQVSSREFVLSGQIQGATIEERMDNERELDRLLTSTSKRSIEQPTTLIFRVYDEKDNSIVEGQTLYIYCRYNGGIGSTVPNENGAYEVKLSFTLVDPYIYSSMQKGFPLDPRVEYTSSYYHILMKKDIKNEWSKCSGVMPVGGGIKKIIRGKDGEIYLGGTFTSMHGEGSNTAYFVHYDEPSDDVLSSFLTFSTLSGATSGVYDMLALANGEIIVCGWFSTVDTVANTHNIARIFPNNDYGTRASALGRNGHPNNKFKINSIDIDQSGVIYAVGEEVEGGANYVYTYDTNTSSWGTLGTLNSGTIVTASLLSGQKVLVVNKKIDSEFTVADVYVTGRFESINSVSGTGGIAKYNGETGAWEGLGDGIASVEEAGLELSGGTHEGDVLVTDADDTIVVYIASGFVRDMAFGKDGKIYMVGNFSGTTGESAGSDPSATSISSPYVIRYNGYQFEAIGLPGNYSEQTAGATRVEIDNEGKVHVLVSFNFGEDYVTLAKDYFVLDGNTWKSGGLYTIPEEYGVTTDGDIYYDEEQGKIWISSKPESGKITPGGEITTAVNNGENIYPKITFVGAGQIMSVYNKTTDKIIEFANYIMQDGEIVSLDLSKYGNEIIKLRSNVNGIISEMIKPSSNISFNLVKGDNKIGYVYYYEGSNSSCRIEWRERYLGIYDAINYRKVKVV